MWVLSLACSLMLPPPGCPADNAGAATYAAGMVVLKLICKLVLTAVLALFASRTLLPPVLLQLSR